MADQTVRRVSRVPKETAALDNTRRLPRRARMVLLVIWIGLLAVFCIAFWSKQRDEFATLGDLLGDIGLWWLLAALALVPLALALTVEIYHTLLRRLGAPVSRAWCTPAHDETLMMQPSRCVRIEGSTACVQ